MNTKWPPIQLGEKQIRIPLIQGGMGVGISLGRLAGAVAKEGAAGIISNAQIGFREPDFEEDPFRANLRAMESEYKKARKTSPDGVIGFNIMVALTTTKNMSAMRRPWGVTSLSAGRDSRRNCHV